MLVLYPSFNVYFVIITGGGSGGVLFVNGWWCFVGFFCLFSFLNVKHSYYIFLDNLLKCEIETPLAGISIFFLSLSSFS